MFMHDTQLELPLYHIQKWITNQLTNSLIWYVGGYTGIYTISVKEIMIIQGS